MSGWEDLKSLSYNQSFLDELSYRFVYGSKLYEISFIMSKVYFYVNCNGSKYRYWLSLAQFIALTLCHGIRCPGLFEFFYKINESKARRIYKSSSTFI